MTGFCSRKRGVKDGDCIINPRHSALLKGGIEVTIDILQTTSNPKPKLSPQIHHFTKKQNGILPGHRLIKRSRLSSGIPSSLPTRRTGRQGHRNCPPGQLAPTHRDREFLIWSSRAGQIGCNKQVQHPRSSQVGGG